MSAAPPSGADGLRALGGRLRARAARLSGRGGRASWSTGCRRGRWCSTWRPGTGKLTRPLLEAGLRVIAVEPVAEMRAALPARRARASPEPPRRSRSGRRASTRSTVGQAFHWFDGDAALAEIAPRAAPGRAAGAVLEPARRGRPGQPRDRGAGGAVPGRRADPPRRRLAGGLRAHGPVRSARRAGFEHARSSTRPVWRRAWARSASSRRWTPTSAPGCSSGRGRWPGTGTVIGAVPDRGADLRPPRDPPPAVTIAGMEQRISLITLGVRDLQLGRAPSSRARCGWRTRVEPGADVVFFQAGGLVLAALGPARRSPQDSGVEDNGGWGGVTLAQHHVRSPRRGGRRHARRPAAPARTSSGSPPRRSGAAIRAAIVDPDGQPLRDRPQSALDDPRGRLGWSCPASPAGGRTLRPIGLLACDLHRAFERTDMADMKEQQKAAQARESALKNALGQIEQAVRAGRRS